MLTDTPTGANITRVQSKLLSVFLPTINWHWGQPARTKTNCTDLSLKNGDKETCLFFMILISIRKVFNEYVLQLRLLVVNLLPCHWCKLVKIEADSCSTFNENCETQNAPTFVWNMISKQIPVFEEHWQRGVATLKERFTWGMSAN